MKKKLPAILVVVAVVLVLGFLGLGSVGDNLVYYWSPAELQAAGPKALGADVRLGGLVEAGSVRSEGMSTVFRVQDAEKKASVLVRTEAIPPQMFREGIGVVVEGSLGADGVFASKRLLVKHDEIYTPPKAGEDVTKMIKAAKE
ncbi:cytochrome c-type biogenesis protein CcmE [Deltaproteobacteria bacterium]|nr:cytochrome c-type biogenesis protein CcmE [Deltaproteobacteria bacterium]